MQFEVDAHTHSIMSGHAFHTVEEMAKQAKATGLKGFGLTDHGPYLMGAPPWYYFNTISLLPDEIQGVRVYKGLEANILDETGRVDMKKGILKKLEIVIASLHTDVIPNLTKEQGTQAMIKALQNPLIDIAGHPGNPKYPLDITKVVEAAAQYKKIIEINQHSFQYRPGSEQNCRQFIRECKRLNVRVCGNSDAHNAYSLGVRPGVAKMLEEEGFPEELIVNLTRERFDAFLEERKERIAGAGI